MLGNSDSDPDTSIVMHDNDSDEDTVIADSSMHGLPEDITTTPDENRPLDHPLDDHRYSVDTEMVKVNTDTEGWVMEGKGMSGSMKMKQHTGNLNKVTNAPKNRLQHVGSARMGVHVYRRGLDKAPRYLRKVRYPSERRRALIPDDDQDSADGEDVDARDEASKDDGQSLGLLDRREATDGARPTLSRRQNDTVATLEDDVNTDDEAVRKGLSLNGKASNGTDVARLSLSVKRQESQAIQDVDSDLEKEEEDINSDVESEADDAGSSAGLRRRLSSRIVVKRQDSTANELDNLLAEKPSIDGVLPGANALPVPGSAPASSSAPAGSSPGAATHAPGSDDPATTPAATAPANPSASSGRSQSAAAAGAPIASDARSSGSSDRANSAALVTTMPSRSASGVATDSPT